MAVGEWTLYATIPPGCKGIVSHPAYGLIDIERDMSVDVEALAAHRVGRLVSMMSADDILSSGMGGLLTDLEGAGIEWTHLPFPSRRLPDEGFPRYLTEQAALLRSNLLMGMKIAVHGRGWSPRLVGDMTRLIVAMDGSVCMERTSVSVDVAVRLMRALVPM
jgi:hypothetical protein